MKRQLISIVSIMVVLAVALVAFGQDEGERSERTRGRRRGMGSEAQLKVIATIEEELGKMKSDLESLPRSREAWQDLSDEERDELRAKFRKMREERQQSIAVIEEQIAKLKGSRQLSREHEESLGKLKAIHELAVKEKAKETAASIEKLIDEKQKEFEDLFEKLGLEQRPRRGSD